MLHLGQARWPHCGFHATLEPAHRWPPLPLGVCFSSLLAVPPGPCCPGVGLGTGSACPQGHLRGTNAHVPRPAGLPHRAARQQGLPLHLCLPQCHCMTSWAPGVPVLRTEPRGLSLAVLCLYHHPSLRSFQLYLPHSPSPLHLSPYPPQHPCPWLCTHPSPLTCLPSSFSGELQASWN